MTKLKLHFKLFSWMKQRIKDWVLEFDIEVESFLLSDPVMTKEERRGVYEDLKQLINKRSPQQIRRMEKSKGLIHG